MVLGKSSCGLAKVVNPLEPARDLVPTGRRWGRQPSTALHPEGFNDIDQSIAKWQGRIKRCKRGDPGGRSRTRSPRTILHPRIGTIGPPARTVAVQRALPSAGGVRPPSAVSKPGSANIPRPTLHVVKRTDVELRIPGSFVYIGVIDAFRCLRRLHAGSTLKPTTTPTSTVIGRT
jgi:hypothetical protein